jgi:FKBP-type peptidyl-prolyl cis-trans isomerase
MLKPLKYKILLFLFSGLLFGCGSDPDSADKITLETRMDTISYIIGLDYGIGIREEQIEANEKAVYKGLLDGLNNRSILPDSVKEALIESFNEELKVKLEEEGKRFLEQNRKEGGEFLDQNKKNEEVLELESGLQYKILKQGEGPRPIENDSVLLHYRAMFIDRTVFDMSYDRGPAGIRLNSVIKGLSEGVQLMREGAIYELYIPPELAYGDKTFASTIPAGSTLIYTVELIEVIK